MDIRFNCPRCDQHISVEERGAGMLVNCPSCKEQIEIPRGTGPPPAPKLSIPTMPVKRGINARALLIIGGIIFFVFVLMIATQHENSPSTPVKAQAALTRSAVVITNLDDFAWPGVTLYLNGTPLDGYKRSTTNRLLRIRRFPFRSSSLLAVISASILPNAKSLKLWFGSKVTMLQCFHFDDPAGPAQ
jgi:hypothetical protein